MLLTKYWIKRYYQYMWNVLVTQCTTWRLHYSSGIFHLNWFKTKIYCKKKIGFYFFWTQSINIPEYQSLLASVVEIKWQFNNAEMWYTLKTLLIIFQALFNPWDSVFRSIHRGCWLSEDSMPRSWAVRSHYQGFCVSVWGWIYWRYVWRSLPLFFCCHLIYIKPPHVVPDKRS